VAALFLTRVGDDGKVRAAHFDPLIGTGVSSAAQAHGEQTKIKRSGKHKIAAILPQSRFSGAPI
jgi:hypothetical protein